MQLEFSTTFSKVAQALALWFFLGILAQSAETRSSPELLNLLLTRLIKENGGSVKDLREPKGPDVTVRETKRDKGGEQVLLAGNHVANVAGALKPLLGEPAWASTNQNGGVLIQYNSAQTGGIGLICSSGNSKEENWTLIRILNAEGLRELGGGQKAGTEKETERKESPEETRAKEVAIKEAAIRGFKGELDAIASHRSGVGSVVTVFEKKSGPLGGRTATVGISESGKAVMFSASDDEAK